MAKKTFEDEELIQLIGAGKNDREIAELLNVHTQTVMTRRKKLGLKSPGRHLKADEKPASKQKPRREKYKPSEKCKRCYYSSKDYGGGIYCDYYAKTNQLRGPERGDACLVYKRKEASDAANRD